MHFALDGLILLKESPEAYEQIEAAIGTTLPGLAGIATRNEVNLLTCRFQLSRIFQIMDMSAYLDLSAYLNALIARIQESISAILADDADGSGPNSCNIMPLANFQGHVQPSPN